MLVVTSFPSVFGRTAERFRTDDKSRGLSGIGTREARRLFASFQLEFRFMWSGLFPASHCLCQKEAARCAFLFLFRRYGMGEGESLDGGCRICGTYGTAARLRGFIFDDVVPRDIISNSTFSFWGAYLAVDGNGMKIYPRRWFRDPTWTSPPIFSEEWVGL